MVNGSQKESGPSYFHLFKYIRKIGKEYMFDTNIQRYFQ